MNLVCPTTGLRVIPLRLSSYRMIQKGLSSLPSDLILYSLLDQAYTFKNSCYIVLFNKLANVRQKFFG